MKMTAEDVEKIKQGHEDAVVQERREALPQMDVKEIRRMVKEHGDGNKVLEILTGVTTEVIESEATANSPDDATMPLPNGIHKNENNEQPQDVLEDILAASMETLSLQTDPSKVNEATPLSSMSPPTTPPSNNTNSANQKPRQSQQHPSAARKQKQTKRAQKEAAKRRKRMQSMGLENAVETNTEEHILKAIV